MDNSNKEEYRNADKSDKEENGNEVDSEDRNAVEIDKKHYNADESDEEVNGYRAKIDNDKNNGDDANKETEVY